MTKTLLVIVFFISQFSICDAAKKSYIKELTSAKVSLPHGRRFRDIVKEKYPENVYIGAHMKYQFWGKGEDFLLRKEFGYISPGWDFKQGPFAINYQDKGKGVL